MSADSNPTGNPDPNPFTIVRHTIPKTIKVQEANFEVTLFYRSVACDILVDSKHLKESCKPCATASNTVKRAARKRAKPLQPQLNLKPLYKNVVQTSCGQQ
jgi:hypothetical protein